MYLELKGIKKAYKYGKEKQTVLHGIDLSFERGEFVSILGESGCGKSTLMNIIGGMDSDYTGDVIVNGKNLKKMNLDNYRKLDIGFIFQNFNLIPHLSVLDNVVIALEMSSSKKKQEKARELLIKLGLKEHLHKRPNQLSGGQKQRVAIARALANDPEIILADEPTGSLDQATSEQIIDILKDIAKSGKLVITVTHSEKVASNSNRIIKMSDGNIIDEEKLSNHDKVEKEDVTLKPKSLPFLKAIKLALHNMRLNLKRNILVSVGGSIGILSVVLMLAVGNGVETYINEQIEASMDPYLVQVTKRSETNEEDETGTTRRNVFEQSDIDKITSVAGIDHYEKAISYNMRTNLFYNNKSNNIMIFTTSLSGMLVLTDDQKKLLPDDNEILISSSLAKKITDKDKYKELVGQKVTVYITDKDVQNRPLIIQKELTVSNILELEEADSYDIATVNYKTLEDAYKAYDLDLKPTMINVYAKDKNDVDDIKAELKDKGFADSQVADMLEQVMNYLNIATLVLAGIAGISLVVSGIMILVVLYISVVERTKEIGILRAIGARKKDVRRIFFTESALLGFFSGVLGVAGAALIGFIGNNYLEKAFDVRIINVNLKYILFGIIVSVIVSIIAGLMPSNKASKLDPMESLRYE